MDNQNETEITQAFASKQSGQQDIIDPRNGQKDSFCCEIQNHNKYIINLGMYLYFH